MILSRTLGISIFPEVRIQVASTRFRVPDVCVYLQEPDEEVFTTLPFLVVEILSPEDRWTRMVRKFEDYNKLGCRHIWIFDPWERKAFSFDGTAVTEATGSLQVGEIAITISELW